MIVAERRYSVEEIDMMRSAVWRVHYARNLYFNFGSRYGGYPSKSGAEIEAAAVRMCEEELRTYMLNGTEPEEVEALALKEEEAAQERVRKFDKAFMKGAEQIRKSQSA